MAALKFSLMAGSSSTHNHIQCSQTIEGTEVLIRIGQKAVPLMTMSSIFEDLGIQIVSFGTIKELEGAATPGSKRTNFKGRFLVTNEDGECLDDALVSKLVHSLQDVLHVVLQQESGQRPPGPVQHELSSHGGQGSPAGSHQTAAGGSVGSDLHRAGDESNAQAVSMLQKQLAQHPFMTGRDSVLSAASEQPPSHSDSKDADWSGNMTKLPSASQHQAAEANLHAAAASQHTASADQLAHSAQLQAGHPAYHTHNVSLAETADTGATSTSRTSPMRGQVSSSGISEVGPGASDWAAGASQSHTPTDAAVMSESPREAEPSWDQLADEAKNRRVEEIMTSPVRWISKDADLSQAKALMSQYHISALLVDTGTAVPGFITKRDFLKVSFSKNLKRTRVRDIMTQPVISVDVGTTLTAAAKLIEERSVRRVLVRDPSRLYLVDPLAPYVGVVSDTDIFRVLGGQKPPLPGGGHGELDAPSRSSAFSTVHSHAHSTMSSVSGMSMSSIAYSISSLSEQAKGISTEDRYRAAAALWELDFNEIEVMRKIGEGSFGEVVLGSFRGTKVAVKRMRGFEMGDNSDDLGPSPTMMPVFAAFFEREIEIMATIRHPNVVNFIGACHTPPNVCLVTEYCARGSLDHLLHKSGLHLDLVKKVEFAMDIARGMSCLHAQRPAIIHRDLKTANLLVSARFEVKVADFGLSRIKDHAQLINSRAGLEGTVEYCAPEVLRGEPYTEKCDIWSYGVVLWELLNRQRPYADADCHIYVLIQLLGNGSLTLPPLKEEACTPGLVKLVERCLNWQPADRPSFREILHGLENEYKVVRGKAAAVPRSDSASSMVVVQSPAQPTGSDAAATPVAAVPQRPAAAAAPHLPAQVAHAMAASNALGQQAARPPPVPGHHSPLHVHTKLVGGAGPPGSRHVSDTGAHGNQQAEAGPVLRVSQGGMSRFAQQQQHDSAESHAAGHAGKREHHGHGDHGGHHDGHHARVVSHGEASSRQEHHHSGHTHGAGAGGHEPHHSHGHHGHHQQPPPHPATATHGQEHSHGKPSHGKPGRPPLPRKHMSRSKSLPMPAHLWFEEGEEGDESEVSNVSNAVEEDGMHTIHERPHGERSGDGTGAGTSNSSTGTVSPAHSHSHLAGLPDTGSHTPTDAARHHHHSHHQDHHHHHAHHRTEHPPHAATSPAQLQGLSPFAGFLTPWDAPEASDPLTPHTGASSSARHEGEADSRVASPAAWGLHRINEQADEGATGSEPSSLRQLVQLQQGASCSTSSPTQSGAGEEDVSTPRAEPAGSLSVAGSSRDSRQGGFYSPFAAASQSQVPFLSSPEPSKCSLSAFSPFSMASQADAFGPRSTNGASGADEAAREPGSASSVNDQLAVGPEAAHAPAAQPSSPTISSAAAVAVSAQPTKAVAFVSPFAAASQSVPASSSPEPRARKSGAQLADEPGPGSSSGTRTSASTSNEAASGDETQTVHHVAWVKV